MIFVYTGPWYGVALVCPFDRRVSQRVGIGAARYWRGGWIWGRMSWTDPRALR